MKRSSNTWAGLMVCALVMAALVCPRDVLADEALSRESAGRLVAKSGGITFAKRDFSCTPPGSDSSMPLGAVLAEPGLETMDTAAVKLSSIVRAGAQGYVFTGATVAYSKGLWKGGGDVMLAGLDETFSPRWVTVIGGPALDIGTSVAATVDGGYAVVAQTRSLFYSPMRWISTGPIAALLSKYAADGALQWAQYHTPGDEVGLNAVVAPASGGIVFGGAAWRDQRWAGFLIKVDNQGAHQWARVLGSDYENGVSWIEKAADGSLLLAGARRVVRASKFDVWLAKLLDSGEVAWARSYHLDDGSPPVFASATAAGGFIIVRATETSGPARSKVPVFAIDAQGEVLWAELYEFDERVKISSVAESSSGHYLLFGGGYRDDETTGPVTLEVDRSGKIVAGSAVNVTQSASTPSQATITENDPVSVVSQVSGGYVVMGSAISGPREVLAKARNVQTRSDFTDKLRSQLKFQIFFVRLGDSGQAGACSRPLQVSQRSLTVKGETLNLPSREIPPERTTFIPNGNLGIERIDSR